MPHAAGLWYEWHGPAEGEKLILSPGLGGSAHYWAPNLAAFAERYRVLLSDHRGTGRSDRDLSNEISVEDMARDVLALMDALEVRRAHFVGHAAGGLIGLALASTAPERLGKLIVVNGWARLDPYTARCFDARLALLRGSGPEAFVRAQPIFLYPPEWISGNSAVLDAEAAKQLDDFPGAETVEKRIAAVRSFDLGRMQEIATETLIIAAADDHLVPAHCGRAMAEALPHATLALQPSGGHASNITEPEAFYARVLPWLAGAVSNEE
jgi:aminoacrylate hydrolase